MDNASLITIISTVIGTGATVIILNMIFILKFIKEPLDKEIDRLEDNLQSITLMRRLIGKCLPVFRAHYKQLSSFG